MGKKTKKTKWRTLEISLSTTGKNYHESGSGGGANLQWDNGWRSSSNRYRHGGSASTGFNKMMSTSTTFDVSEENQRTKTSFEDEYTKITTPRQDVLFKKSYLTKRKNFVGAEGVVDHHATDGAAMAGFNNCGEEFFDYENRLQQSQLVCATSQSYMDASSTAAAATAIYYGGGGGYEMYDPYTGNVTTVTVSAAASCQPILTSVPCRPVPLQSLQWFNPVPSPSEWCGGGGCAFTQHDDVTGSGIEDAGVCKASYSSDSTNVSEPASESSCTTESTTPTTGGDDVLYPPHSYMYPSYVFGTPVYTLEEDEGNLRYCSPSNPVQSVNESTAIKRKKKRKRRKRVADGEEDSESAVEEYHQECASSDEFVIDRADDESKRDSRSVDATSTSPQYQMKYPYSYLDENENEHDHSRLCSRTTISHASVNAPPFVPAKFAFTGAAEQLQTPENRQQSECDVSDRVYLNNSSSAVENCVVGSVESTTTSTSPLPSPLLSNADSSAARCTSFTAPVDNRSKSFTDSTPSSSNSDSGISSPVNEDCASTNRQHFASTAGASKAATPTTPTLAAAGRSESVNHAVDILAGSFATTDASENEPIYGQVANCDDGDSSAARKTPVEREISQDRLTCCECLDDGKSENFGRDARESDARRDRVNLKDDGGGKKSNRNKRSKKSTKISNRSQIEQTAIAINKSADVNERKATVVIEKSVSMLHKLDRNTNAEVEVDGLPQSVKVPSSGAQLVYDEEKTSVVKLYDGNDHASASSSSSSPSHSAVVKEMGDENEAEAETCTSRESVALVAESLVEEIVQHATMRILVSTEKCDKPRLPLTQAVTTWMNERGGLPAATGPVPQSSDDWQLYSTQRAVLSSDSRVTDSTARKRVETFSCVIC